MSHGADPYPDEPAPAEVVSFLGNYAAAWNARDEDALMALLAVPLMIASGERTEFLEDDAAVRGHVEQAFDHEEETGVHGIGFADITAMALPDGAMRVGARKQHLGADGAAFEDYPVHYTVLEERGALRVVAMARPG